ncbi:hypothetical protein [Spirosoma telluris]|uniref:hypothetical protein n=1 Tax=Spirosoma telluris TaxID=2183553 RepID=UPI002FC28229
MQKILFFLFSVVLASPLLAQKPKPAKAVSTTIVEGGVNLDPYFKPVKWRNIGPFRGGRSVAGAGLPATHNSTIWVQSAGVSGKPKTQVSRGKTYPMDS